MFIKYIVIYVYIGLIQVPIKPLAKLRLNAHILLILRDSKINCFHESTLAIL